MGLRLLLINILLITSLWAAKSDWEIKRIEDDFYLVSKSETGLKSMIHKMSGDSKIKEIKKVDDTVDLIIYKAGIAGTFSIVEVYFAAIYDKKNNKFLGHFPYSVTSMNPKFEPMQPEWTYAPRKITIVDQTFDINKTISY